MKLLSDPATGVQNSDATTAFCNLIAEAVIEHITSAAVVTGTCTVTTTGSATAQAGGGPITGTIT